MGKNPNSEAHCKGAWVGSKPVSTVFGENMLSIPEFEPRTIQPVASRCTDYSIPAPRISAGSLRDFFLSLLADNTRVRNIFVFRT